MIYAHGVHMGGGLSLLEDIVEKVSENENYFANAFNIYFYLCDINF